MREDSADYGNIENRNITINVVRGIIEEKAGEKTPEESRKRGYSLKDMSDLEWGNLAYTIATEAADTLETLLFEYFEEKRNLSFPILIMIHEDDEGGYTMNLFIRDYMDDESSESPDAFNPFTDHEARHGYVSNKFPQKDSGADEFGSKRSGKGEYGATNDPTSKKDTSMVAETRPEDISGENSERKADSLYIDLFASAADPRRNVGGQDPDEAKVLTADSCGNGSSTSAGYGEIRSMIYDMESMKGMIYAAMQMSSMAKTSRDWEVAFHTMRLYCSNAKEIVEKWRSFWKIEN